MDQKEEFLFRVLRKEEIEAGNILIPKQQRTFEDWPQIGIDTTFPFISFGGT